VSAVPLRIRHCDKSVILYLIGGILGELDSETGKETAESHLALLKYSPNPSA